MGGANRVNQGPPHYVQELPQENGFHFHGGLYLLGLVARGVLWG
jgi:hypothetical protein